jgi:hypothetical protein
LAPATAVKRASITLYSVKLSSSPTPQPTMRREKAELSERACAAVLSILMTMNSAVHSGLVTFPPCVHMTSS